MSDETRRACDQAYEIGRCAFWNGYDGMASDYPDFVELCRSSRANVGKLLRFYAAGYNAAVSGSNV